MNEGGWYPSVSSVSIGQRAARRIVVLTLVGALLVATQAGLVAAQETRAGDTVVVDTGETVDGGVTVFAGTVIVRGTVDGDLTVMGGSVVVESTGTVTGDVAAVGGTLQIDGTVDGSVEAAAGTVVVGESARIGGDLETGAGSLEVAGTVDGDVQAGAGSIVLRESASVGGDVRYDSEEFVDEGADVGGSVVREDLGVGPVPLTPSTPGWVFDLYGFFVNLLLGAVLLALLPGVARRVTGHVTEQPLYTAGVGVATFVGVVVALVVFAITIIGIPLALVGAVLFGLVAWGASIYGRIAVGTWLVSFADVDSQWVGLVVGMVVVGLLSLVPILGGLLELVVFLLGLGALALVTLSGYRARRGAEQPTPVSRTGERDSGILGP